VVEVNRRTGLSVAAAASPTRSMLSMPRQRCWPTPRPRCPRPEPG
jgi:hypothetical protein